MENQTKIMYYKDAAEEKLTHLEYLLKKYARIQMSAEGFVEEELRECINLINEINKGEQQ